MENRESDIKKTGDSDVANAESAQLRFVSEVQTNSANIIASMERGNNSAEQTLPRLEITDNRLPKQNGESGCAKHPDRPGQNGESGDEKAPGRAGENGEAGSEKHPGNPGHPGEPGGKDKTPGGPKRPGEEGHEPGPKGPKHPRV